MTRHRRRVLALALLLACGSVTVGHGQSAPAIAPTITSVVRFAAIGDMGTGGAPQRELAATMARTRENTPFDFVIMLGDNIYGGDSASEFRAKFERPYAALLEQGVMFYAALGNHDAAAQRTYPGFHMGGAAYYTFKKGNVQFFALDSNAMTLQQISWLTTELQRSVADWKIVFMHHPLYSSATFHGPAVELRNVLEPLFVRYGVQLVFAGHEHVYERTNPQQGIVHVIEGASGQLRKGNLRPGSPLTAAGFDQDLSFVMVEVVGDTLTFHTISRLGATVDSGTLRRSAAAD